MTIIYRMPARIVTLKSDRDPFDIIGAVRAKFHPDEQVDMREDKFLQALKINRREK